MTKVTLDLSTMTMAELNSFVETAKKTVSEQSKPKALARINELTKQAHALISEAEKIADENGVEFSFSLEYGMGGTYYPKGGTGDEDWDSSYEGWQSSSSMC